jgi:transcriptional regulator with XRE-family HTH domain
MSTANTKRSSPAIVSFATRLRKLIDDQGISHREVARRAGISAAVFSRIVSDLRELNMHHAVQIARALETTTEELLRNTTAEHVLRDWIPRTELTGMEHAMVEACRERDLLRAQLAAKTAEAESLKHSIRTSEDRVAQSNVALAEALAKVESIGGSREDDFDD